MRRYFFAAAFWATVAWAQVTPAEIFPQLESLKQDMTQSPSGKAVKDQLAEGRAWKKAAQSALWPQINTSVSATRRMESREDMEKNTYRNDYSFGVDASYPVFHWGATSAHAAGGRQAYLTSRAQAAQRAAQLEDEVAAIYFELLIKTQQLTLTESAYDNASKRIKALADSVQSSVQKEEDTLRLQELRASRQYLKQSIQNLHDQLGEICPNSASLVVVLPEFPKQLSLPAQWSQSTAGASPELALAEVSARQSQLREQEQFAQNKPVVDLVAGYYPDQVDAIDSSDTVDRNNYYAGVRVSWTLFDGFRSQSSLAAVRAQKRVAQENLRRSRLAAARAERVDLQNLSNLCTSYEIALGRYQLAGEKLSAQRAMAAEQSSSESLSNALEAQGQAQITVLNILADYAKLYAKIQRNRSFGANQ